MSFNTLERPERQSHGPPQPFMHRQVHIPSAQGPYSSMTMAALSHIPSDLPIAPLGPISLAATPSEKNTVGSLGMTNKHLQSQSLQGAAVNTTPADSPSTVTDSSQQPGAEHSDSDNEASPSHKQVSAKSKKKKRTRTLTTAPQAAALFALLARTQFPTTSEREEIGRAIGLSARKVQIWFQNQRQKQKKLANTLQSQSQAELATSAPLPLMSQPGYSASHAARLSAGSSLSDTQSLGVTGFGIDDYGAVTLHSPYAEGISRSSGSVPVGNPYRYSPSSGFSSRARTGRTQRPQGHPQLSDYTHSPSQYNVYSPTTIPDFTLPFSNEPPGAIATSSFATQSWFPEDVHQGCDVTSLPHPPTASTSPHVRRFIPPSGPTASAPATRSLYNPHAPLSPHSTSTHYGSASQLMYAHDIPQTAGTTTPPSQVATLHVGSPAYQVHHGSFSYTSGPSQPAFPSTPPSHIPSSSLPESLNPAVHGSPHSNLIPPYPPHSGGCTTLYGSRTSGRSFGPEAQSEVPTVNRKRPRLHEETVEFKRPRQGPASSLSPPASFSETAISSNRNHDAMHVPLPTHPPLFQGRITDPYSEAVPQPWGI